MPGRKGNAGEREVARALQAWWATRDPECRFIRTPLSGGWAGADTRRDFRASGDVMTTAKGFPFVVEVKRREAWSVRNFVEGKRSPVWGWWGEAVMEANEVDGVPMLWVRKNAEPADHFGPRLPPVWLVLVPWTLARKLPLWPDLIWTPDEFGAGVDVAGVMPAGYLAMRLVLVDPLAVVEGAKQWRR
jgi:hypothetical protein